MVVTGSGDGARWPPGCWARCRMPWLPTPPAQRWSCAARTRPIPTRATRSSSGVDGSEASERAVDLAGEIAATSGAPLHIVSVGHLGSAESWAWFETSKAGTEHTHALTAEAEETVTRAGERMRPRTPVWPWSPRCSSATPAASSATSGNGPG